MKKWTVMLIPHDRGDRRSFELSSIQLWAFAGLFLTVCFVAAFFYQRNEEALDQAKDLNYLYHKLEAKMSEIDVEALAEERWRARESDLKLEYERRDAAIVAELSRLYDLEARVRTIAGLPPHDEEISPAFSDNGGQGGPPEPDAESVRISEDAMYQPPHVIYGLHSPSADLMLQEISVRADSLRRMLKDMHEQSDRVSRKPSIWPTDSRRRQITSRFGYRKDPFSRRMRHHAGTDVAAPYGERVQATARGTVLEAGWDNYLGNFVRLDHGYGVETWYGHMSKIGVNVGQQVERGDSIGKVGSTGRSTGPHIHYEVHVNGKRVDPAKYLGQ